MNLAQLQTLMATPGAHTITATAAIDAINPGRQLTAVPVTTPLTDLAQCITCGVLLAELPRPVTFAGRDPRANRLTARPGRTITHAHVTRPDHTPACFRCFTDPRVCTDHTPGLCSNPTPARCTACTAPAVPGFPTCMPHTTGQPRDQAGYLTVC